jgi:putative hydrolase of the HAD superfamily
MCFTITDTFGINMNGTLISDYMVEKLGIEQTKTDDLCNLLYKNYGTTLAGLRV